MNLNQTVAAEVRAAMARAGKRQADIAGVIGMHQGSLSKRLSGDMPFRVDELVQIARAVDVAPSELIRLAAEADAASTAA